MAGHFQLQSVLRGASHPNLDQATDSLPSGADLIVCNMMMIILTLLLGRTRGDTGEELRLGWRRLEMKKHEFQAEFRV